MSTATSNKANPPAWERILTILAVPAVGLALGLPWWIHTTSIERRSLAAVERLRSVQGDVPRVPVFVRGDGADAWTEWMGACEGRRGGWELVPREGSPMGEFVAAWESYTNVSQIRRYSSFTGTTSLISLTDR